jgi:hypothetical protein
MGKTSSAIHFCPELVKERRKILLVRMTVKLEIALRKKNNILAKEILTKYQCIFD